MTDIPETEKLKKENAGLRQEFERLKDDKDVEIFRMERLINDKDIEIEQLKKLIDKVRRIVRDSKRRMKNIAALTLIYEKIDTED